MRPVGRPNVSGGDRGHGRPLRRLRPGRAPDPGYCGGPAPAGAVVDRRPPGPRGPHAGPDGHPGRSPQRGVAESATKAALAGAPGLGDDQVAAVQVLAGEGGSLRAVLAPAGYGKTTMLHTAARAAAADDRPVVAVATTALPAAPETRQLRRPYRAEQAQQRLSPVPATVPPGHSALASCGRPPTAKVRASRKSSSERTTQWRGMRCSAPVRSGLSIYRPAHECSLPAAANRPGYYACQDSIIMLGAKNT
jgi:hypothetical protein